MSENLKRAESLFNRIMNQNKPQERQPSNNYHHRSTHNGNGSLNNHRYKSKYNNTHAATVPNYDLPKRDPVKEAEAAVEALPENHHVLPYSWTIWHHSRSKNRTTPEEWEAPAPVQNGAAAVDSYLQTTNEIEFPGLAGGTTKCIASVEQMWVGLSLIKKTHDLPNGTELLIFKSGINPVWEDPINSKGGRWVFRFSRRSNTGTGPELAKEVQESVRNVRRRTSLIWERLVLKALTGSLIPEKQYLKQLQDQLMNDIAGLVLSVRRDEDIISVWNLNLNFGKRTDDKKGPPPFQARRIICDAVLRVIRECDLITQGLDCIETLATGSTERVAGVSFEYRLHADSTNPMMHNSDRSRRGKYHHHKNDHDEHKEDEEASG